LAKLSFEVPITSMIFWVIALSLLLDEIVRDLSCVRQASAGA